MSCICTVTSGEDIVFPPYMRKSAVFYIFILDEMNAIHKDKTENTLLFKKGVFLFPIAVVYSEIIVTLRLCFSKTDFMAAFASSASGP